MMMQVERVLRKSELVDRLGHTAGVRGAGRRRRQVWCISAAVSGQGAGVFGRVQPVAG